MSNEEMNKKALLCLAVSLLNVKEAVYAALIKIEQIQEDNPDLEEACKDTVASWDVIESLLDLAYFSSSAGLDAKREANQRREEAIKTLVEKN